MERYWDVYWEDEGWHFGASYLTAQEAIDAVQAMHIEGFGWETDHRVVQMIWRPGNVV